MRVKIRNAVPTDAPAIAALEQECFTHPWSFESVQTELQTETSHLFVATRFGRIVGYAGVQVAEDEGYITNVAVTQACRRKGVGRCLVSALEQFGREASLRFLTLELRESNLSAAALYSGCGFVQVGLRRGYYSAPKEDAVLMTLWLQRGETENTEM